MEYRRIQGVEEQGLCEHCGIPLLVGERVLVLKPHDPEMFCSVACVERAQHRSRPGFRSAAVEKAVVR